MSDTHCGGNITGDGQPDVCYEHPIYSTGMRYRGRSIGHTFDNDAEVWTLGGMLNDRHDGSWLFSLAAGDLNREGNPSTTNTVAAVKTEYRSLTFTHRRALSFGEIQASAGVESFDNAVTGDDDQDWRVSLNWRSPF